MSIFFNDKPNIVEVSEDALTVTVISSVGVPGPTGPAGPTGPSGVVAVTAPITNSGTSTSATIGVSAATTSDAGVVQLTDSTSSTSTTTAATPNSVKSAFDIGDAAVPKSGGTMTGDLSVPSVIVTGTAGAGDIILPSQSATPSLPSAGSIALFSTTEAGRIRPTWVGSNGSVRSTDMLPFDRRFFLATPSLAAVINAIGYGNLTGTITGTASAGNGITQLYTSAATALAFVRGRAATQTYSRNTGYFLHTRVAFTDASYDETGASTGCGIYGLHSETGGFATPATPTALPAIVAFYRGHINGGRTDANWQFVTSNGTNITFGDTGMVFATAKTYDFYVWSPAGGSSLFWQVDNITDSTTASGSTSSTLPAAATVQGVNFALQTVDAVARSITWSRSYVEESG